MAVTTKTFVARVLELEVLGHQNFHDLRAMVHDRSAELKGEEEYLTVPSFTPGDTASMPIADASMANGGSNTQIDIELDTDRGYPIVVSNSTQLETNVRLRDTYAQLAMIAHRAYRNLVLTKALADAAYTADQHYEFADTSDNVISWEDILAAAAILDDNEAPDTDRFMAIPASMYGDLFAIEHFISRDKMGQQGETIPSNVIGRIHGFKVVKLPSAQMCKITGSTGAGHLTTGEDCVLFWQKYAIAYAQHLYKMVGPELKAGQDAEWWNLHHKYGADTQNDFVVSYRTND